MNKDILDYKINHEIILSRGELYEKLWKRKANLVWHNKGNEIPHVDVYRFPPIEGNIPLADLNVYMTGGMSDVDMNIPEAVEVPENIELTAYSKDTVLTTGKKKHDFLCEILRWMAYFPFTENTYFSARQTFDVGRPIVPNSKMTAYYFAETPIISADELFQNCPTANGFVHLVPISEQERMFAMDNGPEELLRLFHDNDVGPFFDLDRKSVV